MNSITIQQYLHRPNATELGQGNTNECYMLISTEIDISDIFPVGVEISAQDTQSGKVYKLKAAKIREFRVNQFGDLYRDYDVHPGDEILITKICGDAIEKVFVTVNKYNRIFINVTGNGAEIFNIDRMQNFRTSNGNYSLPVSYSDVNGKLIIKYDGQKKKRQDSPVLTDYYSAVFNGQRLQNRLFFLNIASNNELLTLPKSEYNKVVVDSTFNIDKFIGECKLKTNCIKYQNISDLLIVKRNLVLTGAPGTGKTFIAKSVAADIVSNGTKDWDTLVQEGCSQIGFVQFHPSYDYTDFVEGLRPGKNGDFRRQDGVFKEFCKRAINEAYGYEQTKQSRKHSESIDNDRLMSWIKQQNGKTIKSIKSDTTFDLIVTDDEHLLAKTSTGTECPISYNAVIEYIQTGNYDRKHKTYDPALGQYILDNCPLFFESVDNASDSETVKPLTKKPFVFIIDEINRGELSKIFGELFYSIEPDYRGPKGTVQTQYNNMIEDDDIFKAGFYVPENVYIIGTMNDVDRGVEAMDFAIRRRFGWKEVTAEESADNMGITGLARVKMDALNKTLIEKGLTKAHCIGGAYFRKLEGDDFKALWDYHLEGIIFEYFRGEPDAQLKIDDIKKAYDNAVLPKQTPGTEESTSTEETPAE